MIESAVRKAFRLMRLRNKIKFLTATIPLWPFQSLKETATNDLIEMYNLLPGNSKAKAIVGTAILAKCNQFEDARYCVGNNTSEPANIGDITIQPGSKLYGDLVEFMFEKSKTTRMVVQAHELGIRGNKAVAVGALSAIDLAEESLLEWVKIYCLCAPGFEWLEDGRYCNMSKWPLELILLKKIFRLATQEDDWDFIVGEKVKISANNLLS